MAYPTLNVAIEGRTDSTGGDELNQRLSEQRAESVKTYLLEQRIPAQKNMGCFREGAPLATGLIAFPQAWGSLKELGCLGSRETLLRAHVIRYWTLYKITGRCTTSQSVK